MVHFKTCGFEGYAWFNCDLVGMEGDSFTGKPGYFLFGCRPRDRSLHTKKQLPGSKNKGPEIQSYSQERQAKVQTPPVTCAVRTANPIPIPDASLPSQTSNLQAVTCTH
ncbi:hypothetical protein PoB_006716000 [Plakobranchus ocellatus]|uniref:Uncharacterized protein n=1 Tax=Plakobranchus ocellatus TaxID=259542 RepID=A0AAV4D9B5_9GAST|nr:hypothetical protein PoB_006716000 [Plakobranchus ocellatus]